MAALTIDGPASAVPGFPAVSRGRRRARPGQRLGFASSHEAVELARPRLARERVAGRVLWRSATAAPRSRATPACRLLPAFDELLVGYRDRSATLDPAHADRVHALLSPTILVDDRVAGTWTRALEKDAVVVRAAWFGRPRDRARALADAARAYATFLGRRAVLA